MQTLRNGMTPSTRLYATIASGKSLRGSNKGPVLTLEHVHAPITITTPFHPPFSLTNDSSSNAKKSSPSTATSCAPSTVPLLPPLLPLSSDPWKLTH